MGNEDSYIRKEVEKLTGLPARRIQFYTESGVLSIKDKEPGRGIERQYSKRNLLELLVIAELAKNGIQLKRIKEIISDLPERLNCSYIFDPDTHLNDDRPVFYIFIYPDGRITYGSRRDLETLKGTNTVTIDMESTESIIIINISALAEKLRGV